MYIGIMRGGAGACQSLFRRPRIDSKLSQRLLVMDCIPVAVLPPDFFDGAERSPQIRAASFGLDRVPRAEAQAVAVTRAGAQALECTDGVAGGGHHYAPR